MSTELLDTVADITVPDTGFSCKEVAAMMDSPIGTVMSRLHRGRNRLRSSLFELAARLGCVPGHQLVGKHPRRERRCTVNART
jgi:hypothetical protein